MHIAALLRSSVRRFPEKEALVVEDRRITWRALDAHVNRVARGLGGHGVGFGDRVGLYLQNGLEYAEVFLACAKLGAIVVPINFRWVGDEVAYVLGHCGPRVLVLDAELVPQVRSVLPGSPVAQAVVAGSGPVPSGFLPYEHLLGAGGAPDPAAEVGPGAVQMIAYTAGTSGRPKGAVITHANQVTAHYFYNAAEWGLRSEDRFLATTPLVHRVGAGRLINTVALGATLVLMPRFDAVTMMRLVESERITVASIVPTVGRMFLQSPEARRCDASSLRVLLITGEAFPPRLKEEIAAALPGVRLFSYYAQTEAGVVTNLRAEDQLRKPASVGHPLPGVEVRVAGPAGDEAPAGEVGEIWVRSGPPGRGTVMREYYRDPEATAAAFRDGWLRTGDLGRWDDEGFLYIVDRQRDMIISGGLNIYSKEVEVVLERHPAVAEAAVIGVPDPQYGEAVRAYVVLRPGAAVGAEELQAHCRAAMAGYKKPREIEFVDALPKNAIGKVQKFRLREAAHATSATSSEVPSSHRGRGMG